MKIIKSNSNFEIRLSKSEWHNIGMQSGWTKIAGEVDPKQRSGLTELFNIRTELIGDIGTLRNIDPNNQKDRKSVFDGINLKLEKLKSDNWVVKMDAEMQVAVEKLRQELASSDEVGFQIALDKFFSTEVMEKQKQLEMLDRMV